MDEEDVPDEDPWVYDDGDYDWWNSREAGDYEEEIKFDPVDFVKNSRSSTLLYSSLVEFSATTITL